MPAPAGATSETANQSHSVVPSLGRSWGALLLAILQALCVVSVAMARAGIVLGAASVTAVTWANFFHRDIFRLPILVLAVAGAGFNLYLLWNSRRLRNAPAAAWRKRPLTTGERWRIGLVFCLSIFTLVTAAAEVYYHRIIHHTTI